MFSQNNKISVRQLQTLLILDIFGVGVITLPRRVAELANQDGWILVILGTLLAMGYLWFICSIGEMYGDGGFLKFNSKVFGRVIGYIVSIVFVFKIIISLGLELRIFAEIIKEVMLPKTPMFMVILMMILLGGYSTIRGYETRGRLGEILFLVVIIPVVILLCLAVFDADFSNLKPVLLTNKSTLLKGSFLTSLGFYGIEYVLLGYPYLRDKNKAKKKSILALGIVGIIIVMMTILTIAKTGVLGVKRQLWPVLSIMEAIDLPGSFVERQEALVMSIWVISMFFITNAGILFASFLSKEIANKGKHYQYMWVVLPLIFLVSIFSGDVVNAYRLLGLVNVYLDSVYLIILPILLFIFAKLRGVNNEKA